MTQWSIYVLKDPRTLQIRYVGASCDVKQRLRQHLKAPRSGRAKTHKDHWIAQLLREHLTPLIEVIETPSGDWETAERRWIATFRAMGCRLTNSTEGGEGLRNPTAEVRAKISRFHKGKKMSAEHRARTSAGQRGKRHSAEWCRNIAKANIKLRPCPRCAGQFSGAGLLQHLPHCPNRPSREERRLRRSTAKTKLRCCPSCGESLGAAAMRRHKAHCPNKPARRARSPLSAEQKAKISAGNTGKRRKLHDPKDRSCWCMDCRVARRGRPNGHPRIVAHDAANRSCRCVDCRKKAIGRSLVKLKPCAWCGEDFGVAAMRKHVARCRNKPGRPPVSADIRAKLRAANTGKKRSIETRARLSAANVRRGRIWRTAQALLVAS